MVVERAADGGRRRLAVLAWKDRYWGVVGRVHYTLVALAAVVFVRFLNNWNLIGF